MPSRLFPLRPGVGLFVFRAEVFQRDVRIFLRRREARMAEEFLDGSQVCPAFEQMRGEGVAQRVCREPPS